MGFMVGDRVIASSDCLDGHRIGGEIGTVVCVGNEFGNVGVSFDKNINGHDCGGMAVSGHGWYITPDFLSLYTCRTFELQESPDLTEYLSKYKVVKRNEADSA